MERGIERIDRNETAITPEFSKSFPSYDSYLTINFSNEGMASVALSDDKRTHVKVRDRGGIEESVLSIGAGEKRELGTRALVMLARRTMREAGRHELKRAAVSYADFRSRAPERVSDFELGRLLAEAFTAGSYEYSALKTRDIAPRVEHLSIIGATKDAERGFAYGQTIGKEINFARDLINTPGSILRPKQFAEAAERQLSGTKASVRVLTLSEIKAEGMGLIEGVGRGSASDAEPRFVVVEYWGLDRTVKPKIVIGKGVTFDTGGLNIKGDGGLGMEKDMTGGAVALATVASVAKLDMKTNVVAIVPMVENAIGGKAMKPDDVLRAKDGTTVQIKNTDAEGRLALADAMAYAVEHYDPDEIVESSTLTGSAEIAVGKKASIMITKNNALAKKLKRAAALSATPIAELAVTDPDLADPTIDGRDREDRWQEYLADLKRSGPKADMANIASVTPREAGSIIGAVFIDYFAKGKPFAHFDIAPRDNAISSDQLASGAVGEPVSLFVKYLELEARKMSHSGDERRGVTTVARPKGA